MVKIAGANLNYSLVNEGNYYTISSTYNDNSITNLDISSENTYVINYQIDDNEVQIELLQY